MIKQSTACRRFLRGVVIGATWLAPPSSPANRGSGTGGPKSKFLSAGCADSSEVRSTAANKDGTIAIIQTALLRIVFSILGS
jgi:hypothetical protein